MEEQLKELMSFIKKHNEKLKNLSQQHKEKAKQKQDKEEQEQQRQKDGYNMKKRI